MDAGQRSEEQQENKQTKTDQTAVGPRVFFSSQPRPDACCEGHNVAPELPPQSAS